MKEESEYSKMQYNVLDILKRKSPKYLHFVIDTKYERFLKKYFFKRQLWVKQELLETNLTTGIQMMPQARVFVFIYRTRVLRVISVVWCGLGGPHSFGVRAFSIWSICLSLSLTLSLSHPKPQF